MEIIFFFVLNMIYFYNNEMQSVKAWALNVK